MSTAMIISAVAAVGGSAYQAERADKAAKQQRKAADLQKEANSQAAAQQKYERKEAIKQQMRQQRIKQAQVMSAAEASGVVGSSLESNVLGSGQTLSAAGTAFATGQSITAGNLTNLNQQAADARSSAAFDMAQGQMGAAFSSMGQTGMQASAFVGG